MKFYFKELIDELIKDGLPPRDWEYIVIHHSASSDGKTYDWEAIRKYHMSYRYLGDSITKDLAEHLQQSGVKGVIPPWRDIAYNFGIEKVHYGYTFLKGRPLSDIGAHAGTDVSKKFNEEGIGICLVGNYDIIALTELQRQMLKELVLVLMDMFGIPATKVIGHKEVYPLLNIPIEKTCPGKLFDMQDFRNTLTEALT